MSIPFDPQTRERPPTLERLSLTLFVSGASSASAGAAARIQDICDRHAPSGYDLKIIDIHQEPAEVVARGVLAVPTLIKEMPPPVRVLIGNFTNEARVVAALDLNAPAAD